MLDYKIVEGKLAPGDEYVFPQHLKKKEFVLAIKLKTTKWTDI